MADSVNGLAAGAVAVVVAYALGCLSAGYYLVRMRTGRDVREGGSGATGATNVGRVLGAGGFAATLAWDAAKGALAVWLGRRVGADALAVAACVPSVVAGHLWPVQLGFRGGRGIAPSLGAVAAYDWRVAVVLLACFAIAIIPLRRLVPAGLLAYAATPAVLAGMGSPPVEVITLAAVAVLVWAGHWPHVRRGARRPTPGAAERQKEAEP